MRFRKKREERTVVEREGSSGHNKIFRGKGGFFQLKAG